MPPSSPAPFFPWQRAGAREHSCCRSSRCRRRRLPIPLPEADPRPRPSAIARTGCNRSSKDHTVPVSPPRAIRCGTATEYHSEPGDHPHAVHRAACSAVAAIGSTIPGP
ncbi:hypothetical protein TSH64_17130 [Azospirillum sp. TSH64]|nr:hypothetical protein TSH64_17130 [Azospirillum sp. TSH64]